MPALCDVNFLVALCHPSHQHHPAAKTWLDAGRGDGGLVLCRVSQLGLLRLLNNPAIMRGEVCTTAEAWGVHDRLMTDARFSYREEPAGVQGRLREFTKGFPLVPSVWSRPPQPSSSHFDPDRLKAELRTSQNAGQGRSEFRL